MSVYGYCRISQKKQSIERQKRNIKAAAANAILIEEAYTGTTIDRKEWNNLFDKVVSGDTIIFDSVSRMSRNAEEGYKAYEELFKRGVELVFLKEPHINTSLFKEAMEKSIPMTGTTVDFILEGINKYLLALAKEQIKIAFNQAEKEVLDIQQRTKEGIETARLKGKQIGQVEGAKLKVKKSIKAKELILKHSRDFNGTLDDIELMALTQLSRNTFYKYKRELRIERGF